MPKHLRVQRGSSAGAIFPLRPGGNLIGRNASCAIVLPDDKVSSRHARLEVDAAGCVLTDLESTNGTLLNDSPLTAPARLRPGDAIQLGGTVLVYAEGEMVAERPTSSIRIVVEDDESRPQRPVAWSPEETTQILPPTALGLEAEELRRLYAILSALYRVTGLVSRSTTLDELLASVLEVLFDIVPADRGSVLFAEGPNGTLQPRAARCRSAKESTIQVSRTIVRDVTGSGRGVLTRDATEDERYRGGESIQLQGIRSALCVPIRTPRELFGVIYLDTRSLDRQFTERDLELLSAIGSEVGLAVENFRLIQQSLQAERLAAIGQAVAGLSHYIKNIVQSMESARYLIRTAIADGDRSGLEEAWAALERNTDLISELVLNMLSYSRRTRPQFDIGSPNTVARQVVELVAPRANERGTTFDVELDPAMPTMLLDAGAIHCSLLNLLTNAIDAAERGTVRVASRWDPDGRRYELSVSDNGPGIPPELHETIFHAFFTTKGSKGSGLGLAVTRKLVEELGGRVTLDSAPGRGATFTLSLPARFEEAPAKPEAEGVMRNP